MSTDRGAVVLVPVKSPGTGKSRLTHLSDAARTALAAAFAVDTVAAVRAAPGVLGIVVVTDDADFAVRLGDERTVLCPDPGTGLNAALREAAALGSAHWPGALAVALLADLPALRPDDLAEAIEQARAHDGPSFVVDADGTGTTLYAASPAAFAPRFGAASAAAHRADDARELVGRLETLRRDVDDRAGLAAAVALGVGPATSAALAGA